MVTTKAPAFTTTQYFEDMYAQAGGDAALVPWADQRPQPALVNWLNAVAPQLIRCGARVAVVGCGLGDDARELIHRGYDVTAFDCSPSAIQWARRIDPGNAPCYVEADLFQVPTRWRHRFDLVVEVNTIQSLCPEMQPEAVAAIADLLSPRGRLLVICRHAETPPGTGDGPPWALTEADLREATALAGLETDGPIGTFLDDEVPPVPRMRALFKRA